MHAVRITGHYLREKTVHEDRRTVRFVSSD